MIGIRPGNVAAVFRFEWKRSLTLPRMAWWLGLACFPALITALVIYKTEPNESVRSGSAALSADFWAVMLFFLVSLVVSALGVFLWATPAIATELERRSWVYLATRPNGNMAVLFGRYLVAVSWALSAALIGLTLALVIAQPQRAFEIWRVVAVLTTLSCPAFGAVYSLIGTFAPKRAMVFAIIYTLLFEVVIAFVPAMVQEFTIQFRLRCLLVRWLELELVFGGGPAASQFLFNDTSPAQHVMVLLAMTAVYLLAAGCVLLWKEFSTADDSDI